MISQQPLLRLPYKDLQVRVSQGESNNIIKFPVPARMKLQQKELAELVLRVAEQQDRPAFLQLYRHFAPRLKSFLIGKGLAEQPADDVLQDVMLAVWQKAPGYKPDKAAVSTWIFTIARNKYIDGLRRNERRKESSISSIGARSDAGMDDQPEFEPEDTDALTADDNVMQQQRSVAVKEALSRLPQEQQAVIILSFMKGLAHGEIAEQLGLPLGTVKSRIRLAFKHMRAELGEVL